MSLRCWLFGHRWATYGYVCVHMDIRWDECVSCGKTVTVRRTR